MGKRKGRTGRDRLGGRERKERGWPPARLKRSGEGRRGKERKG